ncbi:site-specific DNA-methyltransferase (adenine-specific)/adenine-specific DNA-methyltransferase [Alteromonas sp. I10]|uniref:site-specific DNA-methyltransferase n=1 Tax=Alteromonas TaxID=226 RepID=UPI000D775E4B|nr:MULTISPECIES: site-specific DNA-methyltransferase [Alteromonas]PXW73073.1 site-specific DNA-methyltransferase (adenine-specific)/adenine-specific DNA-methyltransferase [Alteromonas sp. I10]
MIDTNVEKYEFEPIKSYPMLNWKGKRPFRSTQYYPAQLKEVYGQEDENGWINKVFWGDNLQVMSHLLKKFRGKVDLIYIDPPFDSKADYKKKIKLKDLETETDSNSFEEKQYTDLWNNDEYLQFMYERLIMAKELLSEKGAIYLHCDWHKNHHLRCMLDEIFGPSSFVNEIVWCYSIGGKGNNFFARKHDTIYFYSKSPCAKRNHYFNDKDKNVRTDRKPNSHMKLQYDSDGRAYQSKVDKKTGKEYVYYMDEGKIPEDYWTDIEQLNREDKERVDYPTQKPEKLLKRIIAASSAKESIVFDFFMGSGSFQLAACKLGRKFIGADINLTAVQTTSKRLLNEGANFEVYSVNNYELFKNPIEARELLLEALEVQPLESTSAYDGEKDGFKVKVMPVNRIATKEDLNDLISNFPYKTFEKRKAEAPNKPVEDIMLVCMGHEPGLGATLENESGYKLNVQVVDILRDKADLTFKYDSEASINSDDGKLIIEAFYPRNLLQKLSLQKEDVREWREMVESVMVDWNYDGAVMEPTIIDIPEKNEFVKGEYEIPEGATNIKIKVTDLLSESYEEVISYA